MRHRHKCSSFLQVRFDRYPLHRHSLYSIVRLLNDVHVLLHRHHTEHWFHRFAGAGGGGGDGVRVE